MKYFPTKTSQVPSPGQAGNATLLTAFVLLAVAAIAGVTFMKKGSTAVKLAVQQSAKMEVAAESNKALAIAGFLVANGLVVCREGKWETGGSHNCRYDTSRKDADLRPETFGLSGQQLEGKALVFKLDPKSLVDKLSTVKIKSGKLKFELADASKESELQELIGERPKELESIDADDEVVVASVTLKYEKEDREFTTTAAAAFRRPIAMTRFSLRTATACAARCNSSLSQNPNPSCRGPQTVSDDAVVEIIGTTTNLGPGALYELEYERSICLKKNLNAEIGANGENCDKQNLTKKDSTLVVPIDDWVAPDKSIRWSDTAPCQMFVQTINTAGRVSRSGRTVVTGSAVQHVAEAGRITYQIDATSDKSKIEPFRLNEPVDKQTGKLPGRLNVIYVVPTH